MVQNKILYIIKIIAYASLLYFQFKNYGLSDDLTRKYGLLGLKTNEEEDEDEEYSYEYVTDDEADEDHHISVEEFTKDDSQMNKSTDAKKVEKLTELPKKDENEAIEKTKGKPDSEVEKTSKAASTKKKEASKDNASLNKKSAENAGSAKLLDTAGKQIAKSSNASKTLETSKGIVIYLLH